MIKLNDEVFVGVDPIVRVNQREVEQLCTWARASARGRARLCAHRTTDDLLHEMLIVLTRGTYIRPHRHGGKSESFHVIEGLLDIVIFDDEGGISEVIRMGDYASGRPFYYRLADPVFHTVLVQSELVVFHETTNGPFRREDTIFAPWAPDERDCVAAATYQELLRRADARCDRPSS